MDLLAENSVEGAGIFVFFINFFNSAFFFFFIW